jgi:outer membrane lipoprotein-sorting protein
MKSRSLVTALVLLFGVTAFAEQEPAKKAVPSRNAVVKAKQPPAVPCPITPVQASTRSRSEVKKPAPLFSLNPPVKTLNQRFQVLAGKKEPGASVYINNQQVIPANPYSSWYYEYPYSAQANPRLSLGIALAPRKVISLLSVDLNSVLSLSAEAPRISAISLDDPQNKDIILTIQDPAGVLSYNIYYANDLNSPAPNSCFILAQADFPVSGSGTTTWRDNGSFTQTHPKNVTMRFYKLEIARINSSLPQIITITPTHNSTFLAGAKIDIRVNAWHPSGDALQYQFSLGGIVKQPWSGSNSYSWQTLSSDTAAISITCEVKDTKANTVTRTISYRILNPTAEEILQRLAQNYSRIFDFRADMELSSTLNGQPFGETQYCRYYFKAPAKEKTETYSAASRSLKTDIIIINGSVMYLVNPQNGIKQEVNLLTDTAVNASQFSQLDMYYHQTLFTNGHLVVRDDGKSELNNMLVYLEATPKGPNNLYDQLGIAIDYLKGIIIRFLLYKRNSSGQLELIQETRTLESRLFNNAWLPTKMSKSPNLSAANLVTTLTYDNLQLNTGLQDLDFDPDKQ